MGLRCCQSSIAPITAAWWGWKLRLSDVSFYITAKQWGGLATLHSVTDVECPCRILRDEATVRQTSVSPVWWCQMQKQSCSEQEDMQYNSIQPKFIDIAHFTSDAIVTFYWKSEAKTGNRKGSRPSEHSLCLWHLGRCLKVEELREVKWGKAI